MGLSWPKRYVTAEHSIARFASITTRVPFVLFSFPLWEKFLRLGKADSIYGCLSAFSTTLLGHSLHVVDPSATMAYKATQNESFFSYP